MPESFMKSVFYGSIDENAVFPYPSCTIQSSSPARTLIDRLERELAASVDSTAIDASGVIGEDARAILRDTGVYGACVPARYGGLDLSACEFGRVAEALGRVDASIATSVLTHATLGTRPLLMFGTPEQQSRYLPRIARGECIGAFALTEPGAGSDAAGIRTTATADAQRGGYTLSGEKAWVTNAHDAQVFTVFARTSPSTASAKPRVTAFLVDKDDGVEVGEAKPRLGLLGVPIAPIRLPDVWVEDSAMLGERGKGFHVAMDVLNNGRLALASSCLGTAKTILQTTLRRANERRAFGRPIGEFPLTKDKIARMLSDTYALECMVYLTLSLAGRGARDYSIESAICKVFATETLHRIAHEAALVAGAAGYAKSKPFERFVRDSRGVLVFEGTNEILRCFIALSGMQGPSRELSEVARAVREPIKGFGLLSEFAMRKAKSALNRERLTRAHPALSKEAVIFEEYVVELARNVEKVLRKHTSEIAEMQYTQERVAGLATYLYATAAIVSRTTRAIQLRGERGALREIDLTIVFVESARRRMESIVTSFERNDDELRKAVATRALHDGAYPFDWLDDSEG